MKPQNKPREQQKPNIRRLEKALSLKERLFSIIALKRGVKRAQKWLIFGFLGIIVLWLAWEGLSYTMGQADNLGLKDSVQRAANGENAATEEAPEAKEKTGAPDMAVPEGIGEEEYIPIVYIETETGTEPGSDPTLFMGPQGLLFPVDERRHGVFMGVPVWHIDKKDADRFHGVSMDDFKAGNRVNEDFYRPIAELIVATNKFDPLQLPRISLIMHPKPWKLVLILETGTEVTMSVEGVTEQVERLVKILEHARVSGKTIISANVIQQFNPTVIYDTKGKGGKR